MTALSPKAAAVGVGLAGLDVHRDEVPHDALDYRGHLEAEQPMSWE
jgi:hypothetical protein